MRYLDRRNANLFDDMFDDMFRAPVMNNNTLILSFTVRHDETISFSA